MKCDVYTWAISEHLISKIFLGGHVPRISVLTHTTILSPNLMYFSYNEFSHCGFTSLASRPSSVCVLHYGSGNRGIVSYAGVYTKQSFCLHDFPAAILLFLLARNIQQEVFVHILSTYKVRYKHLFGFTDNEQLLQDCCNITCMSLAL